jgi:hypothetical protein
MIIFYSLSKKARIVTNLGILTILTTLSFHFFSPVIEERKVKLNEVQTANWEIYQNEKYGIEFKYPPGWYIWDEGENTGIYIYEQKVGPDLPGVSRLMHIYRDTNVVSESRAFTDAEAYAQQNSPNYDDSDGYFTLLEETEGSVVVDQILSYQTYTKILRGGPQECYEPPCDWSDYENAENLIMNTYIPHTKAIFTVRAEMAGEVGSNEEKKKVSPTEEDTYLNTYRQILSTVNFLD